jgi:hypothetical protein
VFEWPIFAVFAVYMWWNLLHDTDEGRSRRRSAGPAGGVTPTDDTVDGSGAAPPSDADDGVAVHAADDADLAAWQAYLHTMEAEERRQAREDGLR